MPTAFAFALHDRRRGARVVAAFVAGAAAALVAIGPGGGAIVIVAAAAVGLAAVNVARDKRPDLADLIAPTIGGAGLATAIVFTAIPGVVESWETSLGESIAAGAAEAIERYHSIGLDPATVGSLESMAGVASRWVVRLWPAVVASGLWLGTWFGYRMVARWGLTGGRMARRLTRLPFASYRPPEAFVWLPVLALAAAWIPVDAVRRVAENALLVGVVVYGLAGLAVAAWWADRRGFGTGVRLAVIALLTVFLPPVLVAGSVALGLADVWIEIRDRPDRASRERQGG